MTQYSADRRRQYQRAYRASGRDNWLNTKGRAHNVTRPFVGFDGEGGNLDSGYHAYFLLSSGRSSILPHSGNVRLTTTQCFDFMSSALDSEAIHVVYFGDYDFTKIVEDIPFPKLERLMNRSSRIRKDGKGVFPVSYGEFDFDYLPRKYFKVRRAGGKWIEVSDVGSFFQCRFVEALEKWDVGTPEERAAIGIGKEQRGNFAYSNIGEISRYNKLEIKLLGELMEKFRAACIAVGCVPAKWQGPGQLAEALFAAHGVPKSKEVRLLNDPTYSGLMDFARSAFYGGRPEISVLGPVRMPVFQWDINSAYPYAMREVPCLIHGRWVNAKLDSPRNVSVERLPVSVVADYECAIHFGSFYASVKDGENPPQFFGLPVRRKDGTIVYPAEGRGWYWDFEIRESVHQRFMVEETWVYQRECDCRPLGFTEEVYRQRKALGKDGKGQVLKLALNSLYGKTVQSVGSPKYANPIWGSFITAWCRMMIQRFIHSSPLCVQGKCGQDVLMIATDSVCTTTVREDIDAGEELGQWSMETHPGGIFFVQPGLYFGTSPKPAKTRGVPREVISDMLPVFESAFAELVATKNLASGDVSVPQSMFCGVRYALHRRDVRLLGQWISFRDPDTGRDGKRITFDWASKRAPFPVLSPTIERTWLTTLPQWGDPTLCTVPYSRDIGGIQTAEMIRGWVEAQPDWADDIAAGFTGE